MKFFLNIPEETLMKFNSFGLKMSYVFETPVYTLLLIKSSSTDIIISGLMIRSLVAESNIIRW